MHGKRISQALYELPVYEVTVPTKERTNNSKAEFLVNLTTIEHEAVIAGAGLPADKLVIPESWQKQAIPVVPAPESESAGVEHDGQ